MKQHATTLFGFGEISSVAESFDQMALFEPPTTFTEGIDTYPNWKSIPRRTARPRRGWGT